VASPSVVELEPGGKSIAALGVGEEDLPVCPRDLWRAVVTLDLAVRPGAVGPDEDVLGVEVRHGFGDVGGQRLTEVVVGHDALNARDSEAGEVGGGPE
jgi:hypothetical protein